LALSPSNEGSELYANSASRRPTEVELRPELTTKVSCLLLVVEATLLVSLNFSHDFMQGNEY
jgi:hypothetical protein